MFRKSLLCASLLFVGCGQVEDTAFRDGLPSKETVELKSPGGTRGQGLKSGEVSAFGQGDTSEYYALTRGATEVVNGGTAAVLTLIEEITEYPPTSITGEVAVWGPYSDALKRNAWKLTVTQKAEHEYTYELAGKAKEADDSAFKVILSGTHAIALDAQGNRLRNYGSGSLKIDWDAEQTLPEHGKDLGVATIRYTRESAATVATVEADFRNVKDDERPGTRVNADYRYKETPGAGGEFDFALDKNLDKPGTNRPGIEHITVKSRWTQNGMGRSDVKVTGGDMGSNAGTVSDCWDSNFNSQYLTLHLGITLGYGTVDACGSFSTPVYSLL
ncbi:hypothetical protein [Hyalangium rubrum]|uniref:Lipoprotein n=1 Tax=Hyalangium rubrum TaxID=3103134 RepID=A0ABU5HAE9_9BACT|nr:hypothetical protein [Hyalangium sp. s54d21]MDY7229798.1 hypothetical protein [Hyalangium sp. s54d21]